MLNVDANLGLHFVGFEKGFPRGEGVVHRYFMFAIGA